ncbi:MAG: DUF4367 domain-containing protein [Eubacterium sp.]|nr:DUF4367 domain-containing protein [Eubacterium sp.]
MIRERIETERLLRRYGKALVQSHVRYVEDFVPRERDKWRGHRSRRALNRAIVVMLVAVLLFASIIMVCDAFGVHLFWFQKDQKAGHALLKAPDHQDGTAFYIPSYTVKGYHRIDDTLEENQILVMTWQRGSEDVYYTITETTSREAAIDIDTENLREEKKTIGDVEVLLFYNEDGTVETAYFQRNRTFVGITGPLPKEEMVKVITSMALI